MHLYHSIFELTRIKVGLFIIFCVLYFGYEGYKILTNEFVHLVPLETLIASTIFFLVVFYVVSAFIEFVYLKVRK